MKDITRQISLVVTVLITLVVNGLANALPLNGQNTGQISDRFNVYFVPAGYVFSILSDHSANGTWRSCARISLNLKNGRPAWLSSVLRMPVHLRPISMSMI